MKIVMNTDGGARGNPGPAGIGIVIKYEEKRSPDLDSSAKPQNDSGEVIKEISEYIGETTNNQAEYKALIAGLEWILKVENEELEGIEEIECRLDSELVVKQLNKEYKMKNEGLKPLFDKVNSLVADLNIPVKFFHVYRSANSAADKLVNKAIDTHLSR